MTDTCLPEDKEALHAMIIALQAQNETLQLLITTLIEPFGFRVNRATSFSG